MKWSVFVRLVLGACCVVGIALMLPTPAWADHGTCPGQIAPGCACGVGAYSSCRTLWGACGDQPSGSLYTYWDCVEDPPGVVHPANVTYYPYPGCGGHCQD